MSSWAPLDSFKFQTMPNWGTNATGLGPFSGQYEISDPRAMFKKQNSLAITAQVQRLKLAKAAAENPDKVLEDYTNMMGQVATADDPFISALLDEKILGSFRDRMPFLSQPEVNAVYLSFITDAANRYTQMITMANPVALRIAQDIGTELNAPIGIGRGPSGSKRSSRRSSGR